MTRISFVLVPFFLAGILSTVTSFGCARVDHRLNRWNTNNHEATATATATATTPFRSHNNNNNPRRWSLGTSASVILSQAVTSSSSSQEESSSSPLPLPLCELQTFLKLCGVVQSGGAAKVAIQGGECSLNGAVETRRAKKLFDGDVVAFGGSTLDVRDEVRDRGYIYKIKAKKVKPRAKVDADGNLEFGGRYRSEEWRAERKQKKNERKTKNSKSRGNDDDDDDDEPTADEILRLNF